MIIRIILFFIALIISIVFAIWPIIFLEPSDLSMGICGIWMLIIGAANQKIQKSLEWILSGEWVNEDSI